MSDGFLKEFQTLDEFNQESLKAIALATKASNSIPSDRQEDWDFYTTFKSFRQVQTVQSETIRAAISKLLKHNGIKVQVPDNPTDMLEMLSEANDQLLERVNTHLDEALGLKKDLDPVLIEVSSQVPDRFQGRLSHNKPTKLLAAKQISRPQLKFKDLIDNSCKTPFIPRLKEKYHALKPLSILIEYSDQDEEIYSHPYIYEIDNLKLIKSQLEPLEPVKSLPINDTPLVYIQDKVSLEKALTEMESFSEIGIDLEAHTYRSFQGITCLIQMSTPAKDYIIDPFPLWSELPLLNKITANPKIVKIFHGAKNDLNWLQRDFSVYVVNMFDTYVAAKVLDFPRGCLSLAFLLHTFCAQKTEKKFQLADWRVRPLPAEMTEYARMDTHYLIEIYAQLKRKLCEKSNENLNLVHSVYRQSSELCSERYSKPAFDANASYKDALMKQKISYFNAKQTFAFREIFNWRNGMARQEDESEFYVLPAHMLIKICTELPREMQGILACCNPVPPLVKQNLHALHDIILKAREIPMNVDVQAINSTKKANEDQGQDIFENPLKCPLDLHAQEEYVPQQWTVLDSMEINDQRSKVELKTKASVVAFEGPKKTIQESKLDNQAFYSPYQRYKMLKPYLDSIKDSSEEKRPKVSDEDRIKSIKEHFDALTSLTPQEMSQENEKEVSSNSEEDDNDLDRHEPIKREKIMESPVECKKAKMSASFDQNSMGTVDFSQYSSGVKAGVKTFDPNRDFLNDNHRKRFAGKINKFKKKSGQNKSYTYSKK